MDTALAVIPYEKQSDAQTARSCGAACLSMVYRSMGKEIAQAEIWPAIAKENRFGSIASTTHLMAKDALSRGFAAVALQARHPLQALRLCLESGTRAVLNQRPTKESPTGHYTVLVDMDDRDVVLHDPFYGPSRRMPHAELLELWKSRPPVSEIAGYVLIAIAAQPPAPAPCWLCHAPMPPRVACPRCQQPVGLQPGAVLGCMNGDCIARMWNCICCPSCDYVFTFSLQADSPSLGASGFPGEPIGPAQQSPANSASPSPAIETPKDPFDLSQAFTEIDKFCKHTLSAPGAADHPEISKLLDFVESNRERLRLALAEARFHHKTHQEQLAKIMEAAKQNEEAHRKKLEELNQPSPPLDGDALGQALLKNLGFIK